MTKTQKITLAIVISVILVLIVAIAAFVGTGTVKINPQKEKQKQTSGLSQEMKKQQSEEAARETQKLIDEVKDIADKVEHNQSETEEDGYAEMITFTAEDESTGTSVVRSKGVRIAPGSSIIDLNTGSVVNNDGETVDNSAPLGTPEAPSQSQYVYDEEKLPESSVKLEIGADFIEPASFTIKAGQAVSLVVTASSEIGGRL